MERITMLIQTLWELVQLSESMYKQTQYLISDYAKQTLCDLVINRRIVSAKSEYRNFKFRKIVGIYFQV
jgi:hypothetical protein